MHSQWPINETTTVDTASKNKFMTTYPKFDCASEKSWKMCYQDNPYKFPSKTPMQAIPTSWQDLLCLPVYFILRAALIYP